MRRYKGKFITLDEDIVDIWRKHGWGVSMIAVPKMKNRNKKYVEWEIHARWLDIKPKKIKRNVSINYDYSPKKIKGKVKKHGHD